MPRYEFTDLYIPAFDISGSGDKATNEPSLPDLTMAYTPIEPTYLRDVRREFALFGNRRESSSDRGRRVRVLRSIDAVRVRGSISRTSDQGDLTHSANRNLTPAKNAFSRPKGKGSRLMQVCRFLSRLSEVRLCSR